MAKTIKQKSNVVLTSGKRKTAIARAFAKPGKGIITVNKKPIAIYTPEFARLRLEEPMLIAGDIVKAFDIHVDVRGGGWSAQAEAARLAIAKAIVQLTNAKELKKKYLDYDRHLLVADTRYKEPRKFGTHSRARAKRQKSYR